MKVPTNLKTTCEDIGNEGGFFLCPLWARFSHYKAVGGRSSSWGALRKGIFVTIDSRCNFCLSVKFCDVIAFAETIIVFFANSLSALRTPALILHVSVK